MINLPQLPVSAILAELKQRLNQSNRLVLEAPPGAGKSTLVALSLLDAPWCSGKIILLEPRRLAARAVACRMADLLGESVGQRVGYRVKQDSRISNQTRIEVITEGILVRWLQQDPTLDGISAILFDEFHERSLDADLALSLSLEVQQQLRPELRLLLMSATLDGQGLSQFLACTSLTSQGRQFPVDIQYRAATGNDWLSHLGRQLLLAIQQSTAEILVFLPGSGEIRRLIDSLSEHLDDGCVLSPLYGDLDWAEQQRALQRQPGKRRIVLATPIAETSLTIEGIELVIDSGWQRRPRFDPNNGLTRLELVRISDASADQRAGRAGRLGPGQCWRLWPATEKLAAFEPPEILHADLSRLALELAAWGSSQLQWLDAPPSGALAQAQELLMELGALNASRQLTELGKRLSQLPLTPRLGRLLLAAEDQDQSLVGASLAAYLSDPDRKPMGCDLVQRTQQQLQTSGANSLFQRQRQHLQSQIRTTANPADWSCSGLLLAYAYPDRIAKRRLGQDNRYQLSNGTGASFAEFEALALRDWLVIPELSGRHTEARIFLAAELRSADIDHLSSQAGWQQQLLWLSKEQRVQAEEQRRLGALILEQRPLQHTPAHWPGWLCQVLRQQGLALLDWTDAAQRLQHRLARAHQLQPQTWPAMDEPSLLADLERWLAPYLPSKLQRHPFAQLDLYAVLKNQLDYPQQQQLDRWLPEYFTSPAGARHPIDYQDTQAKVSLKLQEVLGLTEHPQVAGSPLLVELLSPAQRPIQITSDLPGFWRGAYAEVRKDMQSQYPRHFWPENALLATASIKTNKKALAREQNLSS